MKRLFQDKEWLYDAYRTKELSSIKIAKICNCTPGKIFDWMEKFNISTRNATEANIIRHKNNPGMFTGEKNPRWKGGKKKKEYRCSYCEKLIEKIDPLPSPYKRLFCNEQCYLKFYPSKIKVNCSYCSKVLYIKPSGLKLPNGIDKKNFYCNLKCKGKRDSIYVRGKNHHSFGRVMTKEKMKNLRRAMNIRPNKPEKTFNEMTPDIIRYVGDGSFWKTLSNKKYKNPDFKVTGQNKVIEIYGNYWHKNDDPNELINLYNQIGMDCLIVWEQEIYKQPKLVMERVNNFISI